MAARLADVREKRKSVIPGHFRAASAIRASHQRLSAPHVVLQLCVRKLEAHQQFKVRTGKRSLHVRLGQRINSGVLIASAALARNALGDLFGQCSFGLFDIGRALCLGAGTSLTIGKIEHDLAHPLGDHHVAATNDSGEIGQFHPARAARIDTAGLHIKAGQRIELVAIGALRTDIGDDRFDINRRRISATRCSEQRDVSGVIRHTYARARIAQRLDAHRFIHDQFATLGPATTQCKGRNKRGAPNGPFHHRATGGCDHGHFHPCKKLCSFGAGPTFAVTSTHPDRFRQWREAALAAKGRAMNASLPEPASEGTSPNLLPLRLLIAAPRGFCAGVDRAIEIVERALQRYGAPVYVRHEIVHNRFVVDGLKAKGATFVEELDQVPDGAPVVFSAHGVPKVVPQVASERGLDWLDATCPLVSKVHRQAERQVEAGRHILFIGHKGHPEVIGTMGQVPAGTITLVETLDDVARLSFPEDQALSFLTQTTLSVDDTAEIVAALQAKFPQIVAPKAEDICYATSNRQAAVKAIAEQCQLLLVIGAPNSSNSLRLVEVAQRLGTPSRLIQRASEIDPAWLDGVETLGLTAGASAPEVLVREVVDKIASLRAVTEETVTTAEEKMVFKLPRQLVD